MSPIHITNPKVLIWARESAGLSLEVAALESSISDKYLTAIERGKIVATRLQLTALSKVYHRPMYCLYLSEPPPLGQAIVNPRMQVTAWNMQDSQDVEILIRDLLARHQLLKIAIEHRKASTIHSFIGSLSPHVGAATLAKSLVEYLGFDRFHLRNTQSLESSFLLIRQRLESIGVAVMISGHVAFHHAIMPTRLYGSFSVIDAVLPLISINENLSMANWIFAMIHELAHLFIADSGLSNLGWNDSNEKVIDQLCDDAASEFLLPSAELERLNIRDLATSSSIERLTEVANQLRVSPQRLASRLLEVALLPEPIWRDVEVRLQESRRQHFRVNRLDVHQKLHANSDLDVRCLRLGEVILNVTRDGLSSRAISLTEAGQLLGIQPRKVQALLTHTYVSHTSSGTPTRCDQH